MSLLEDLYGHTLSDQDKAWLRHFHNGLKFGYPPCCVDQFATERVDPGVPPGQAERRGSIEIEPGRVYVPCDNCLRRGHPDWHPHNFRYLMDHFDSWFGGVLVI